jgi:hypothetical protein
MNGAMDEDGGLALAADLNGMVEGDRIGVVQAEIIDDDVVAVGKMLAFERVKVVYHIESYVDPSPELSGKEGREFVVVVIDPAGDEKRL